MSGTRRSRLRRRVCMLSVMGTLVTLASPARAADDCQWYVETIPVYTTEYRPIAIVNINGRNLPMMVNNASAYTMLTTEAARKLKLPLGPRLDDLEVKTNGLDQDYRTARVSRFKTGTLAFRDIELLVADLDLGLSLQGVLGRDLLAIADTEYDLALGTVRMVRPKGQCDQTSLVHWADGQPITVAPLMPRDASDTEIRVSMRLNKRPVFAMLGASHQFTTLQPETVRAAGVPDSQLQRVVARDGVAGQTAHIDLVQIGSEQHADQALEVERTEPAGEYDLMLGVDFMLSHRIYVAYSQGKLYATRNGLPAFTNRAGYGSGDREAGATAAAVKTFEAIPGMWAREGEYYFQTGQYRASLDAMNCAIALKPGAPDQLAMRARAHRALGDAKAALLDAEEALRLDPALHDARFVRAAAGIRVGQPERALEDLNILDRQLPIDAESRFELGQLYGVLHRVPEALRQWDRWIEFHAYHVDLPSAYNERCFLRATHNLALATALQDCERAVALEPTAAAYQDSLGWVRWRMGDAEGAKSAFDEAIRLETGLAWSLYGRSWVWLKQGDAARAREDLAAARKSLPDIDKRIRELGLPAHERPL